MQDLASRLKALRANKNQAEFAEEIGISVRSLSRYENGLGSPDLDTINKICDKFGVSPQWLAFGDGSAFPGEGATKHEELTPPPLPAGAVFSADVVFDVVETLEEFLQAQRRNLPPGIKAEVIRQLCQMVVENERKEGAVRPGQMLRLIQGALSKAG